MALRKQEEKDAAITPLVAIGSSMAVAAALMIAVQPGGAKAEFFLGESRGDTKINDQPTKFYTVGDIPERPALLIEWGENFLGEGKLQQGFELPTGAVWAPALWVFGTLRSAIQTIDTGIGDSDRVTDWTNRFDLFANLQLTATEKIVLGIRPLDKNRGGQFSGYRFEAVSYTHLTLPTTPYV